MNLSQTYTNCRSFISEKSVAASTFKVVCASLFLALCAQITIPLYFTPVPITGQTFGVMLIGALLGSKQGAMSVLLYIVEGALGMPVFAAGSFGIAPLIGLHAGYFVGFIVQAYLTGLFFERMTKCTYWSVIGALLVTSVIQMGLGVVWLAQFIGFSSAMVMGFYPFVLGGIIKILAVSKLVVK